MNNFSREAHVQAYAKVVGFFLGLCMCIAITQASKNEVNCLKQSQELQNLSRSIQETSNVTYYVMCFFIKKINIEVSLRY